MASRETSDVSSPARPAVVLEEAASPIERFIAEHVTPRGDQLLPAADVQGHQQLVEEALQRRRVTVRHLGAGRSIFIFGGVVVGGMEGAVTSLVSANARRIARNAWLTKQHLLKHEVATPDGRVFGVGDITEAAKYLGSLNGPGVLKPVTGHAGHGITTHLRTAEDLQQAWQDAADARLTTEAPSPRLLLEDHHEGLDVRAFVVGGRLVSAIVRVPLHVVGDGASDLESLLRRTLAPRWGHEHLAAHVPQVQQADVEPMGLTLQTVLDDGQLVILNQAANIRAGGIPVDVTDLISEDLAELAVEALWAVPELRTAGIDLLVPDLSTAEGAVVLEANVSADIVPHHYPAYGTPRMVADAIAEELLATASK